jgi:ribosomal protein L22
LIKTHKEDKLIRPVINNIEAPSYKLAEQHNKKNLNKLIILLYTYATKKSKKVAQELSNIQTNDQHKITTLDIKDLYVNLPTQNAISITNF